MKKADIETYYDNSRQYPSINVKWHSYVPRIVHDWKETGHEFSGDAAFWEWVENTATDEQTQTAWDTAAQCGWEGAKQAASDVWGEQIQVFSAGRQGGHLIIDGLSDVDEWDAIQVSRWSRFARLVQSIMNDLDYQLIWHLYVNVYESAKSEAEELARRMIMS